MQSDTREMYERALVYLEKWELEKAQEELQKIVELEPEHARAWNKLGVVFARKKDLRQAEDCFNQAVQNDPQLASAYSNLGNVYSERGWKDRAKIAYEQALALDPEHPAATHNLGVLYRKAGEIGKGVELIKRASKEERVRFRRTASRHLSSQTPVWASWVIVGIVVLVLYLVLNK